MGTFVGLVGGSGSGKSTLLKLLPRFYAPDSGRIKIDGLRLVGGNPDFTNVPGHDDDDARFHDRPQAYVHARVGIAPLFGAPKT